MPLGRLRRMVVKSFANDVFKGRRATIKYAFSGVVVALKIQDVNAGRFCA